MDSLPTLRLVLVIIVVIFIIVPYFYILIQIFINECLTTEVKNEEKKEEESLLTLNSELVLNPDFLKLDHDQNEVEVERFLQPQLRPQPQQLA
jgi:hypothetical protein